MCRASTHSRLPYSKQTVDGIYVTNKTLTLDKTIAPVTVAKTELMLTDNTTTSFNQG